jgi:TonB-linked SusC/RagA family outer membrane protein
MLMRTVLLVIFLCVAANSVVGQSAKRIVKGTLLDPDSKTPMPGVNVIIKGTTIGTTTDAHGVYQIEAPIGSTIVFSFVGYTATELIVTEENSFPIGYQPGSDPDVKTFHHKIPDDPEKTLSPYFFIKSDDPSVDQMPLKSTSASVSISGVIADVNVKQVYVNTGKNALEAVYIFPGSTRAAVYGMTMTIGSRKLLAKIKEKQQARQQYEVAKSQGKTATLLEQTRPNVFQMNVANILPGDTIAVELSYTELLVPENGTYEFVYPTVVGPRYSEIPDTGENAGEKWVETPYHREGEAPSYTFHLNTILNTGIPVQRIACPSHKVDIRYENPNRAVINLNDEESQGGSRDYILRYRLRGGNVESGLLLHPGNDENFFLLMVEPPEAPKPDQIPPREYIFVVDVSGSMQGFPIQVSKKLLSDLISSLRPTDVFNVMLFESSNEMLHRRSVPATSENIREALQVLQRQRGTGGTRLYPALQEALSFPKEEGFSRTFLVVTDGYVTVEKEAFKLISTNLGEANLFAFGIGSSVNRYLIEGLAHAGMGEPFIVTGENEAEAVSKRFKRYVESPVLTSINIRYSKFDVHSAEPSTIPDVFAERPILVYGKYNGAPEGSVTISGFSGNKPWQKKIDLSTAVKENNEALRYLWARNRIKYLDDYAQFYEQDSHGYNHNTASDDHQDEVTALGLKYNLLTQYTSFIAVDSLIRNPSAKSDKVNQPLPLPSGVSDAAIGQTVAGLVLAPDIQSLSEIVVVGYGSQSRSQVCSVIATVESKEIGQTTDLVSALQGRVTGVSVTQNSFSPGASSSVRVRGNHSIGSSSEPLYVVDGVVMEALDRPANSAGHYSGGTTSGINSNEVESVTVLKGISATAIYGSRGANGVIVITTKNPRAFRREVEFTSTVFLEKVNRLPARQQQFAQGSPQEGSAIWRGPETGEAFSWGPSLSTLTFDGSPYAYDRSGRLVSNGVGTRARNYDPYNFFRFGSGVSNSLRFGQRKDKYQFNVLAKYRHQAGVIPGTSQNGAGIDASVKRDFNRLSVGGAVTAMREENILVHQGNSPSAVMFALTTTPPSFDIGNGLTGADALKKVKSHTLGDGTQRTYSEQTSDNPYWSVRNNKVDGLTERLAPSLTARYELSRSSRVKTMLSADYGNNQLTRGFDKGSVTFSNGAFYKRREEARGFATETFIEVDERAVNTNVNIKGSLGLHTRDLMRSIDGLLGENMETNGLFEGSNVSTTRRLRLVSNQLNRKASTSVLMSYKSIVNLTLSAVVEKTSTLDDLIHSESVGSSVNFSEMPFINNLNVFSSGKIFGSLGRIQREAPLFIEPSMRVRSIHDQSLNTLFAERTTYVADGLGAEGISSAEVGTEMDFLNGRVAITASLSHSRTTDAYVPDFSDGVARLMNGATISNSTLEAGIQFRPAINAFQYTVGLNFTRTRSNVRKLLNGGESSIALAGFEEVYSGLIEGKPYGVLVGSRYLRDEEGRLVIGSDGFPLVDVAQGVIGNPNPDWSMGIDNTMRWKFLTLSFLVDIRYGGDIWNGTRAVMNYYGTGVDTEASRGIRGYIYDGVDENGNINTVPVNFADDEAGIETNRYVRYGKAGVAEDYIEDGSWIRLRQVSLTTDVAQTFASRLKMNKLSLTVSANNLVLLTKYKGVDPDSNFMGTSNGRGIDYMNLPNVKTFSIALKATF